MMKRCLALLILAGLAGCYGWECPPCAQPAPGTISLGDSGAKLPVAPELIVIEKRKIGVQDNEDLPRGGELRAKQGDKTVPLPLKHTDVKAQVSLCIGSVTVKQRYHNPYDGKIEAIYVFPLPENAAVRDFIMTIGDRRIRGVIREREEARKIYEEARRQGYVASLLTQERPNIFTQSIANIEPGKAIDVDITYFNTLSYAEGEYDFVFPMVVGPRYNPPGYKEKIEVEVLRPTEISTHDISMEVDIDAGVAIERLECLSHKIDVQRQSESRVRVRLSDGDRIPNKDFVLRYKVAGKRIKSALAVHRDETGGYFTLMLQPPGSLAEIPAGPREMVFVLDVSGSMSGEPIEKAKTVLKGCLRRMSPRDSFQIVRFAGDASRFAPSPVAATDANVARALEYVESSYAEGGTNMLQGIVAALDFPHDENRYRIVAFMTDGYIGNDREIIGEVRKRLGPARVFSFGVGTSVNRYLLDGMAKVGRGAVAYIGLNDPDLRPVEEFYRRVEHPAMTDIRIDWGGMKATEIYPNPLPDLFVGSPVVLTGRFSGEGKTVVRVTGTVAGRPQELEIAVDLSDPGSRHKALASVWARGKIAELYSRLMYVATPAELVDEIRSTALQYGLLSEFTSFIAVDSTARTAGDHGTSVVVPVPVPAGVKYETTVERK